MEDLYIAIAVIFNIMIILWKYDKGRGYNATFDVALLCLVFYAFSGSEKLLVIGTIASAGISLILTVRPPKFLKGLDNA